MSTELIPFDFEGRPVRVVTDAQGEPWFVAADVCAVLELPNTTRALARLDPDEQALISIQGISRGNDQVNVVNEPGLYSLVLGSRKREAKHFKRWVTHEVLPAIRKTGQYAATAPQALAATPALDAQTIARINRHAWALAQSTFERYRRELTRDIEKGFHRKAVEEWQPPEYRAQFIERLAGSAAVLDHFAEAIRRDTKSLCDMGGVDYDAVTKAYRSLS